MCPRTLEATFLDYINKYRLLAFIVCHKKRRRNSMIYCHERNYITAKEIGIATNTYNKYFQQSIKLGYLIPLGEHLQFIDLGKIIRDLFDLDTYKEQKLFSKCRFFTDYTYNNGSYKNILTRIQLSLAERNFNQQEYCHDLVAEASDVLHNRKTGSFKRLRKLKRLMGAKDFTEVKSMCKRQQLHIKTGKYHLAKILGCSPATATKRLRDWAEAKLIAREVIKKFIPIGVNPYAFDALKAQGHGLLIPFKGYGYYTYRGSKVKQLPNNL